MNNLNERRNKILNKLKGKKNEFLKKHLENKKKYINLKLKLKNLIKTKNENKKKRGAIYDLLEKVKVDSIIKNKNTNSLENSKFYLKKKDSLELNLKKENNVYDNLDKEYNNIINSLNEGNGENIKKTLNDLFSNVYFKEEKNKKSILFKNITELKEIIDEIININKEFNKILVDYNLNKEKKEEYKKKLETILNNDFYKSFKNKIYGDYNYKLFIYNFNFSDDADIIQELFIIFYKGVDFYNNNDYFNSKSMFKEIINDNYFKDNNKTFELYRDSLNYLFKIQKIDSFEDKLDKSIELYQKKKIKKSFDIIEEIINSSFFTFKENKNLVIYKKIKKFRIKLLISNYDNESIYISQNNSDILEIIKWLKKKNLGNLSIFKFSNLINNFDIISYYDIIKSLLDNNYLQYSYEISKWYKNLDLVKNYYSLLDLLFDNNIDLKDLLSKIDNKIIELYDENTLNNNSFVEVPSVKENFEIKNINNDVIYNLKDNILKIPYYDLDFINDLLKIKDIYLFLKFSLNTYPVSIITLICDIEIGIKNYLLNDKKEEIRWIEESITKIHNFDNSNNRKILNFDKLKSTVIYNDMIIKYYFIKKNYNKINDIIDEFLLNNFSEDYSLILILVNHLFKLSKVNRNKEYLFKIFLNVIKNFKKKFDDNLIVDSKINFSMLNDFFSIYLNKSNFLINYKKSFLDSNCLELIRVGLESNYEIFITINNLEDRKNDIKLKKNIDAKKENNQIKYFILFLILGLFYYFYKKNIQFNNFINDYKILIVCITLIVSGYYYYNKDNTEEKSQKKVLEKPVHILGLLTNKELSKENLENTLRDVIKSNDDFQSIKERMLEKYPIVKYYNNSLEEIFKFVRNYLDNSELFPLYTMHETQESFYYIIPIPLNVDYIKSIHIINIYCSHFLLRKSNFIDFLYYYSKDNMHCKRSKNLLELFNKRDIFIKNKNLKVNSINESIVSWVDNKLYLNSLKLYPHLCMRMGEIKYLTNDSLWYSKNIFDKMNKYTNENGINNLSIYKSSLLRDKFLGDKFLGDVNDNNYIDLKHNFKKINKSDNIFKILDKEKQVINLEENKLYFIVNTIIHHSEENKKYISNDKMLLIGVIKSGRIKVGDNIKIVNNENVIESIVDNLYKFEGKKDILKKKEIKFPSLLSGIVIKKNKNILNNSIVIENKNIESLDYKITNKIFCNLVMNKDYNKCVILDKSLDKELFKNMYSKDRKKFDIYFNEYKKVYEFYPERSSSYVKPKDLFIYYNERFIKVNKIIRYNIYDINKNKVLKKKFNLKYSDSLLDYQILFSGNGLYNIDLELDENILFRENSRLSLFIEVENNFYLKDSCSDMKDYYKKNNIVLKNKLKKMIGICLINTCYNSKKNNKSNINNNIIPIKKNITRFNAVSDNPLRKLNRDIYSFQGGNYDFIRIVRNNNFGFYRITSNSQYLGEYFTKIKSDWMESKVRLAIKDYWTTIKENNNISVWPSLLLAPNIYTDKCKQERDKSLCMNNKLYFSGIVGDQGGVYMGGSEQIFRLVGNSQTKSCYFLPKITNTLDNSFEKNVKLCNSKSSKNYQSLEILNEMVLNKLFSNDYKGKKLLNNGDVFYGNINNQKIDGFGRYEWNDGEYHVGYFKNNLPNGFGFRSYNNGYIWLGFWKDGYKYGYGEVYTEVNNSVGWANLIEFNNSKWLWACKSIENINTKIISTNDSLCVL